MRAIVTTALGMALAFSGAVDVQAKTVAKAPVAAKPVAKPMSAPPTEEELKAANDTLSLMVSAFNSKDIPNETKAGLLLCLYGNPLGKITRSQAQAMAADKSIDAKSPVQRLLVIAAVCGAPLPAGKDAAQPVEPTEKPKSE